MFTPKEPADYLASKVRDRVVVHLDDGQSIRGVLQGVYNDCLVLDPAAVLSSDGSAIPVDGGAVPLKARISWIQPLPPAGE